MGPSNPTELKFRKNVVEEYAITHRQEVLLNGHALWVSPMELQVAFKLYLGTDKDLEDARHLYEVAKPILNREELTQWIGVFQVPRDTLAKAQLPALVDGMTYFQVVSEPSAGEKVSPSVQLNLALGIVLGVMLGVFSVFDVAWWSNYRQSKRL